MGTKSDQINISAESRFKKMQKVASANAKSMSDYEVREENRRILSAKLREIRLAKEAEDRAAAALAPVKAKKPRVRSKAAPARQRNVLSDKDKKSQAGVKTA